ncbi:MAG: transposase, partial [Candidatus Midichloria mitochondrii]|nr:transposase [Candidatus Midichloria mitochondrii]MDJ1288605.1 transposase [Candidatus Midichloria mitochondrii]
QTGTLTQQKLEEGFCHNLRTSRNKVFKDITQRGKTSTPDGSLALSGSQGSWLVSSNPIYLMGK